MNKFEGKKESKVEKKYNNVFHLEIEKWMLSMAYHGNIVQQRNRKPKMHCKQKQTIETDFFFFSFLTINLTLTSGSCIPGNQTGSKTLHAIRKKMTTLWLAHYMNVSTYSMSSCV